MPNFVTFIHASIHTAECDIHAATATRFFASSCAIRTEEPHACKENRNVYSDMRRLEIQHSVALVPSWWVELIK